VRRDLSERLAPRDDGFVVVVVVVIVPFPRYPRGYIVTLQDGTASGYLGPVMGREHGVGHMTPTRSRPMDFTYRIETDLPYEQAIERVTETLQDHGFGVLTRIDMRQTLQDKIGVDTPPQMILGACNPHLAHQATTADPRIAALLPCNVVVRTEGDRTVVEALSPSLMAEVSGNDDLRPVADDAAARIRESLDAVGAAH
jgi:uncharacterized protein (DUF302 family)